MNLKLVNWKGNTELAETLTFTFSLSFYCLTRVLLGNYVTTEGEILSLKCKLGSISRISKKNLTFTLTLIFQEYY